MEYIYLGDRWTSPEFCHIKCDAVRRSDGKCIRGKNGTMLVMTEQGKKLVVIARLLRRQDKLQNKK